MERCLPKRQNRLEHPLKLRVQFSSTLLYLVAIARVGTAIAVTRRFFRPFPRAALSRLILEARLTFVTYRSADEIFNVNLREGGNQQSHRLHPRFIHFERRSVLILLIYKPLTLPRMIRSTPSSDSKRGRRKNRTDLSLGEVDSTDVGGDDTSLRNSAARKRQEKQSGRKAGQPPKKADPFILMEFHPRAERFGAPSH